MFVREKSREPDAPSEELRLPCAPIRAPHRSNPRHSHLMRSAISLQNVLVGTSALLLVGAHFAPEKDRSGPVLSAAVAFVSPKSDTANVAGETKATNAVASVTAAAV